MIVPIQTTWSILLYRHDIGMIYVDTQFKSLRISFKKNVAIMNVVSHIGLLTSVSLRFVTLYGTAT